jgi:hypothetical protein
MKKFLFVFMSAIVLFLNFAIVDDVTLLSCVYDKFRVSEYEICDGYECVELVGDLNDVIDVLDVEIYRVFELEDRLIVEGYVNGLNNDLMVDCSKVNVQLSGFDGRVIVGSPLIKKSF